MKRLLVILLLTSFNFAQAKEESFFLHVALGISQIELSNSDKVLLSPIQSLPQYENVQVAVDFGFYIPMSKSFLIGLDMSGVGDSYQNLSTNSIIQMNYYLSALSMINFLGDEASGLFFRLDLGETMARLVIDGTTYSNPDKGVGGLAGIGFKNNNYVFALNYCAYTFGTEAASSISTTIGIMW